MSAKPPVFTVDVSRAWARTLTLHLTRSCSSLTIFAFFSGEPNPPKLEVKLQSPGNEMKVSWIKQDDGGSPIKQYLLSYRPVSMMGYEVTCYSIVLQ